MKLGSHEEQQLVYSIVQLILCSQQKGDTP